MDAAGIRRTVQIPVRVGAAVAGVLSLVVAFVFLVGSLLVFPQLAPASLLFGANALLALRISVSSLGVMRVPRKTLVLLIAASAWLLGSGGWDLDEPPQQVAGLFVAVAVAALLLDLAYRTPRAPIDEETLP